MRTRAQIESDHRRSIIPVPRCSVAPRCPIVPRWHLLIELLLDIREQNQQLLAIYEQQVANERDAILKASSVQGV